MPGCGDLLHRPVRPFRTDVAHRGDPAPRDLEKVADVTAALTADPDTPDADHLDRRGAERLRRRRTRLCRLPRNRNRARNNRRAAELQEITSLQVVHAQPSQAALCYSVTAAKERTGPGTRDRDP